MMSTSGGPPQVVPGGSVTPQKRNKSGSHPSPTPLMSAGPQQQQPTSNGQVGGPPPPPTLAGNQPSAIQPPGKAAASASVAAANNTKHQASVTQTPASVVGQPPFQVWSLTQFFNKLLRSQISNTEKQFSNHFQSGFFLHFEKNSRPKKLKPKKTQANFPKNSSK